MSKMYKDEEKMAYIEKYKKSGENIPRFALENGIPETTLRDWLKADEEVQFGAITIKPKLTSTNKIIPIIFSSEKIRIELKEGYDRELLKQIVEVLIHVN